MGKASPGVYLCLFHGKVDASCVCLQVHAVIGVLMDDTDPLVTVMKVEKAPQETYADIGGLDNQIQEIKVQCGTQSNERLKYTKLFFWHVFLS